MDMLRGRMPHGPHVHLPTHRRGHFWPRRKAGYPRSGGLTLSRARFADDRQQLMEASYPPVLIDPHCLVALNFLYSVDLILPLG
jgi:hypothetical protein